MSLWLVLCSGCIVARCEYDATLPSWYVRADLMRGWGFPPAITVRKS